jgi:glycosyltransferase involved in cell wall biosynthesis
MKVLHIIHRFAPAIGGSEKWCFDLSNFLVSHGIISKVATISLYRCEEFHRDLPSEITVEVKLGRFDNFNGTEVIRYKLWSLAPSHLAAQFVKFLLRVTAVDRTEIGEIFLHSPHSFELYSKIHKEIRNADIVHLHTLPFFHNIVGFLIAKLYGKKIAVTPHFHSTHKEYERKIFYRLMSHCDAVFTVTQYERDHLIDKGIPSEKIFNTGNCIDAKSLSTDEEFDIFTSNLRKRYNFSADAKKIIFVGRKELYKGIGFLIEASKQLAGEISFEICLFLVGPDTADFNQAYPDLRNSGNLKIINFGIVTEKEKDHLIRFSDVLVLPSKFEAFGIVFLEAWKHLKPVIGADHGAVPEVIRDAGLCVKYGDASDLKEKIKTLLLDAKLAAELGKAGREKLDSFFSLEKIGSAVLNTYRRITNQKKRALIVSGLLPPHFVGGAEITVYEQARLLKKMGFDIRVFAGRMENRLKRFRLTRERREVDVYRINLHDFDLDHDYFLQEKEELQAAFQKILYDFAPDLVHFHNIRPLSLKLIDQCYERHIPTLLTLHDYYMICFKSILLGDGNSVCLENDSACTFCKKEYIVVNDTPKTVLERNRMAMDFLKRINLIISPSHFLLNRFIARGLPLEKAVVLDYGIDTSRFNKQKKTFSKKIRFGYIGQIIEHKGIENLLYAISGLTPAERQKLSLVIVGSGEKSFFNFCKKLSTELKLSPVVNFLGRVDNPRIPKIFNQIDALIVPSIWPENSPVVIREALACGTPVLASRIGGIPELIEDGVHGFLHRHDNPGTLAINIKKIIEQPEMILKMRRACLNKARENDLSRVVKTIATHYDRLILNH